MNCNKLLHEKQQQQGNTIRLIVLLYAIYIL